MKTLTDAELLLLGLVAEMPRHGYELEHVIEDRGMREWTGIAFSSIYFVLNKLEGLALVKAEQPSGEKARKQYSVTATGKKALRAQSLKALGECRPAHASVLMGMIHWPLLNKAEALKALRVRKMSIANEQARLEHVHISRQPLPDHVDVMFEYSLGQLAAESDWVTKTIAYMELKPELK